MITNCGDTAYTSGLKGMYFTRCGDTVASCVVTGGINPVITTTEYTCNGQTHAKATAQRYDVTGTVKVTQKMLSVLFGAEIVNVQRVENGVTVNGRSMKLPIGQLPSGLTVVMILDDGTNDLHYKAVDVSITGLTLPEVASGSLYTVSFTASTTKADMTEWPLNSSPLLSPALTAYAPLLSFSGCSCPVDELPVSVIDDAMGTGTQMFSGDPQPATCEEGCPGFIAVAGGGYVTVHGPLFDGSETGWGVVVQVTAKSDIQLVDVSNGALDASYTYATQLLTVNNGGLPINISVPPENILFGYSNDGQVYVNGSNYNIAPNPALPAANEQLCAACGGDGILYGVQVFNRPIALSDV